MLREDLYGPVASLITSGSRFLVTTHINPDGDGIGSMLALAEGLTQMGKEVALHVQDAVPSSLAFLRGADRIAATIPAGHFDAAIMVDCSEPSRAGSLFDERARSLPLAVIDHHLYAKTGAAVVLLDEHAASAGEVVWRLMGYLGVARTADIANAIYTTLVVDTGFFRYSNTTRDVLATAAELVGCGAQPWLVARNLDESHSAARLKLLARSLETLAVSHDGRYASMEVTARMLEETGAALIDSDEFAPYPRSIKSVEVSALFREVRSDTTKVSMRSKDHVNVAEIARCHNGGGHARAAGFTLTCDLATAKKLVAEEVEKALGVMVRET